MTQADARSNAIGVHQLVWVPGWSESECDWALQATKQAGYDFIEIDLADPSRVDGVRTRKQLANYGLSASCSTSLGFDKDVSSPDPDVVQRGEALLLEALDVASALGAHYLGGVLYSALGKYMAPAAPGAESQVAAVLRRLADQAQERGITIGLEVVNRYETNLVNTAKQALALIELTGAPNMVVHLDVYHMNIEEGDLERPVIDCGDRLGYVHIGESHRGYLGTGTIDLTKFFRALARARYSGPIAFESFSSAVISTEFCSALGVWRDLWDDGEDLARQARQFIQQQLDAARRAVLPD